MEYPLSQRTPGASSRGHPDFLRGPPPGARGPLPRNTGEAHARPPGRRGSHRCESKSRSGPGAAGGSIPAAASASTAPNTRRHLPPRPPAWLARGSLGGTAPFRPAPHRPPGPPPLLSSSRCGPSTAGDAERAVGGSGGPGDLLPPQGLPALPRRRPR